MPTPDAILSSLRWIANDAAWVSMIWHGMAAFAIAVLLAGYRPERWVAATSLSLPLASVSIVAFALGSSFNGAVFSALSIVLALAASKAPSGKVALGSAWAVRVGSLLIAFGWIYPHFIEGKPWHFFVYGAPLGVIPCPTLSALVGVALLADGFGATGWCVLLICAASFYSLFGILRLGVALDVVLLAGAVALGIQLLLRRAGRTDHAALAR